VSAAAARAHVAPFAPPFFGMQPIRMYDDTAAYRQIVCDPAWLNTLKVDDWRCFVMWTGTGSGLVSWSNTGNPLALPPDVARRFAALDLPRGTALDGCLMGKRGGPPGYIAFDLAFWAGKILDEDMDARRDRIGALGIELVETLPNVPEAYRMALAKSNVVPGREIEGIVMHRIAARYRTSNRPKVDTADQIKVKRPSRLDKDGNIKVKG
jgi:hypothetical protein